jgi:hypothetical protein
MIESRSKRPGGFAVVFKTEILGAVWEARRVHGSEEKGRSGTRNEEPIEASGLETDTRQMGTARADCSGKFSAFVYADGATLVCSYVSRMPAPVWWGGAYLPTYQ